MPDTIRSIPDPVAPTPAERAGSPARAEKPTTARLVLAFGAVYLIWGSTYLAIRFAIEGIPPFLMAGVRFLVAGAILYGWFRGRGEAAPGPRQWRAAAIAGGLLLLGGNGLLSWAEQHVPSGIAALLVATVPLWMVWLAGRGVHGVRTGARELGGLVSGLLGVGLLLVPSPEALANVGTDPRGFLLGASAVLVGSFLWAAGSVYSRRAPLPPRPLYATGVTMLAGGALLLAVGVARGELGALDPAAVTPRSVLALLYLVVLGSLVAFSAYTWLLRVAAPALVGTYAYVNPVVAVLLGWALAGEPLDARTAIGASIVLASVAVVRGAPRRRDGARSVAGRVGEDGTGRGIPPYRS